MPETVPHTLASQATQSKVESIAAHIESQPKFDFEELKQTLTDQLELIQKQFKVKHRNLLRWSARQGYTLHFLSEHASKAAVSAGLVGGLLAGTPQFIASPMPGQEAGHILSTSTKSEPMQLSQSTESARQKHQLTVVAMQQKQADQQQEIMQHLLSASQVSPAELNADGAADMVSQLTGIPATAELEGFRLNTSLGRIGAEQHLRLYPGQTLEEHFSSSQERLAFQSSGFAPGAGAYGSFAPSAAAVTPQTIQREKYYVAIQTFLSPNWKGNVNQTYNWFRYRKIVIYHPITQKAVVAVVGDAGPALSTGKNYGGSPEVMSALSTHDGYGSSPVMMFFVDDPDNQIPLGPVNFKAVVQGQ